MNWLAFIPINWRRSFCKLWIRYKVRLGLPSSATKSLVKTIFKLEDGMFLIITSKVEAVGIDLEHFCYLIDFTFLEWQFQKKSRRHPWAKVTDFSYSDVALFSKNIEKAKILLYMKYIYETTIYIYILKQPYYFGMNEVQRLLQ